MEGSITKQILEIKMTKEMKIIQLVNEMVSLESKLDRCAMAELIIDIVTGEEVEQE